jgi:hypothetical protein
MAKALTKAALKTVLERLASADREELIRLSTETFDRPVPKGWSRPMLRRVLAAELQGRTLGTLTKAERHQLEAALPGVPTAPLAEEGSQVRTLSPAVKLTPGTRLVREWHGKTFEVVLLQGGRVSMGDRTYRSLSAVATAITGTRWSGPLFFGLRNRKSVPDPAEASRL